LDTFREILTFLVETLAYRKDVDHIVLRRAFSGKLRGIVNPYRHQRFLSRFREPADLEAIRPWLEIWIEALAALGPSGMAVPDWHAAYDQALYRVLSAFASYRRNRAIDASEAWTEAATICQAWLNNHAHLTHTDGYKKLDASYHLFDAYAWRAKGEAALDCYPSTAEEFESIANLFENGVRDIAKSGAKAIALGNRAREREYQQLLYLEILCRYRSALLKQDIGNAAKFLVDIRSISPKLASLPYFDDIAVLKAEEGFLRAYELLREGDIAGARRSAEKMLAACLSPGVDLLRRKWRRLRVYALQLLDGEANAIDYIESLFGKGQGLGGAARYILNICRDFVAGRVSLNAAASALLAVFPLDSYAPEGSSALIKNDRILDILPEFYKAWLDDLEPTLEGVGKLLFLVWQYSANVAEYLCGLYELKKSRGEFIISVDLPSSLHLMRFSQLRATLDILGQCHDWAQANLRKLDVWILEALALDPSRIADFREETVVLFGALRGLYPHAVRVRAQDLLESEEVEISLDRIWCSDSSSLRLICMNSKDLVSNDVYFLKPRFNRYQADTYHERAIGQITFYKALTLGAPRIGKFCLLVEGRFDVRVFGLILDEFLPYWRARIELFNGGGDSLPDRCVTLMAEGYDVTVVADADKREVWQRITAFFLEPDLEGVDTGALTEAVMKLWGTSIGRLKEDKIKNVIVPKDDSYGKGTVHRLRLALEKERNAFSLPDDNTMKDLLSHELPAIWIREGQLPDTIANLLLHLAFVAFGIPRPTLLAG